MFHQLFKCGAIICVTAIITVGCARHQERPMITAVGLSPENRCDPPGIPYYLPKPLLVVAKNVRHIDESKVGLTGPVPIPVGFDNQAAYGDIKANVTVPGSTATPATDGKTEVNYKVDGTQGPSTHSMIAENITPSEGFNPDDGVNVDSFFTYQVIFIPDLTQKYGLQISGGAGEFRAAMNMVNGWMYTGAGPFYMKDSSSAQNAMATGVAAMYAGRGAADVLNEVGELATAIGQMPSDKSNSTEFGDIERLGAAFEAIARAADIEPRVPEKMLNYAEIYIYEPFVTPGGTDMQWKLIAEHKFDRDYFSVDNPAAVAEQKAKIVETMIQGLMKMQTTPPQPPANPEGNSQRDQSEGEQFGGNLGPQGPVQLQGLNGPSNSADGSSKSLIQSFIPKTQVPGPVQQEVQEALPAPSNSNDVNINIDSQESRWNPLSGVHRIFHCERPKMQTRVMDQSQVWN